MFKKLKQMAAIMSLATERGDTGEYPRKWPDAADNLPSTVSMKQAVVAVGTIAAVCCGQADATNIGMNASSYGDIFATFQGCFYVVAGVLLVCYLAYIAYLVRRPTSDSKSNQPRRSECSIER